ncbi:MAG: OmpA family protein [Rhodospirillales bacterium]|nr:OmpA family protein [Rhodospirillales bacterium]MCW8861972.1 OmpA family protein [Rhodospirillales bacterium]MCW8951423.1 OmpA family protein [Rhodospirillales bacterium]MCW8970187.1 OmpA family protein [Rhodospirillales bacterium]MCW9001747.1 OmpA family protein [Rhodospirillales bacterium]
MSTPNWGKKKPQEESEDWLTTYADAITLLMAFFVMLVSISKVELPLYEKVAAGIAKEIGKRESVSPLQLLKIDLQDIVFSLKAEQAAGVGTDSEGLVMELDGSALFEIGAATIRQQATPLLLGLSQQLNAPRYKAFTVAVEGHTDDDPISTPVYPSNWELSSGRAASVVRFFIEQGVAPQRLKAVGFADTQPKYPNRKVDGTPLPENKAENRRVVIRIRAYPAVYDYGNIGRRMGGEDMSSLVGTTPTADSPDTAPDATTENEQDREMTPPHESDTGQSQGNASPSQ